MSENPCQKDNLYEFINGNKQLREEIKKEIIAIVPGMSSTGPGADAFNDYAEALAEAIADKVSEGVTSYLNTLRPILTVEDPNTGEWSTPSFAAIPGGSGEIKSIFSDET